MHQNVSDGFTICRVYASKWLRRVLFFHFFLVAGIKVENSKLRTCQNMVWKGFCCLVIYANLHNLPCIFLELDDGKNYRKALYLMVKTMVSCKFSLKPIQWYMHQNGSDGYFFHFLVIVGIKGEKRKLSTWQNMVWKAFLLFGDLCYSSQFAVYMHQNGSDGNRFTFLVSLGIKVEKKKLETWQNMAWTAFLLFGDLC